MHPVGPVQPPMRRVRRGRQHRFPCGQPGGIEDRPSIASRIRDGKTDREVHDRDRGDGDGRKQIGDNGHPPPSESIDEGAGEEAGDEERQGRGGGHETGGDRAAGAFEDQATAA